MLELAIAVVISSIAIVGLYGVFTMQSRQFLYQDMQMEMHQNLRFGIDMMTRSIRLAGFNSDGYASGVMGQGSDDETMPAVMSWDAGGPDGETDAITLVYGDPNLALPTSGDVVETCGTTTLTFRARRLDYEDRLAELEDGDLIICVDYANTEGWETYLWEVDGDPDLSVGQVNVASNTSYADYSSDCPSGENISPVIMCSKAHIMTFYVDADDTDGYGPGSEEHPVLMLDLDYDWPSQNDVPLVDDIEDLQFEYCVNTSTEIDCSVATNWTDTVTTGMEDHVWMVRVSMGARSPRTDPNKVYQSTRASIANRAGETSSDNYYRQVMAADVTVRNLRYQENL